MDISWVVSFSRFDVDRVEQFISRFRSVSQPLYAKTTALFTVRTVFQSTEPVISLQDRLNFDSTSSTFVLDITVNVHIVNDITYFVGELKKCPHKCVSIIGGQDSQPSRIGLVPVCVVDDESNISVMPLKNTPHFPESPVNIISIVCIVDTYDDDDGTFIKTSRFSSEVSWENVKTIYHTDSRIPEIQVFKTSSAWKALASIAK